MGFSFITLILLITIVFLFLLVFFVDIKRIKPNALESLSYDAPRVKSFPSKEFNCEKPLGGLIKKADSDLVYLSDKISLMEQDIVSHSSFKVLEKDFVEFSEKFEEFKTDLSLELTFIRSELFFKKFKETNQKKAVEEILFNKNTKML